MGLLTCEEIIDKVKTLSDLEGDLYAWSLVIRGIHPLQYDEEFKSRLFKHIVGYHGHRLDAVCQMCGGKGYIEL